MGTFHLSAPSPERNACGHSRPDRADNQPSFKYLPGAPESELRLRFQDPNLVVGADINGNFTVVYDEGFNMWLDEDSAGEHKLELFSFFYFYLDSEGTNHSVCEATHTGWYTRHRRDGSSNQGIYVPVEYGCYYGLKKNNSMAEHQHQHLAAAELRKDNNHHRHSRLGSWSQSFFGSRKKQMQLEKKTKTQTTTSTWTRQAAGDGPFANLTLAELNKRAGIRRSMSLAEVAPFLTPDQGTSSTSFLQVLASGKGRDASSSRPTNFSWLEYVDPVIDQGDCGSCYTISALRMLAARRRILLNNTQKEGFSVEFPLRCSEYNQGCDGGYPFLQSKWASDVGLLDESCYKPLETSASSVAQCGEPLQKPKSECIRDLWRAVNFRYIGGFYGSSNEEKILTELVENGPLVVSFEPKNDFMHYKSGIYQSECAPGDSSCGHCGNEWERVDHAVLLIGYGESVDGNKYWLVQNSWGPEWGEKGLFKIKRGENESGIESIAVAADVEKLVVATLSSGAMHTSPLEKFLLATGSLSSM